MNECKPTPVRYQRVATGAFSHGRHRAMRNSQQARNSGPGEVKLGGKRSTHQMANLASGRRLSPLNHGARTPPPLSRSHGIISWLQAVLSHMKGGQS